MFGMDATGSTRERIPPETNLDFFSTLGVGHIPAPPQSSLKSEKGWVTYWASMSMPLPHHPYTKFSMHPDAGMRYAGNFGSDHPLSQPRAGEREVQALRTQSNNKRGERAHQQVLREQ